MKRISILAVILAFMFALAACGGDTAPPAPAPVVPVAAVDETPATVDPVVEDTQEEAEVIQDVVEEPDVTEDPDEEIPVDEPVDPADEAPGDETPVAEVDEPAPSDEEPTDVEVDEPAPADEEPVDEPAPADEAPVEEAPAAPAPGGETIIHSLATDEGFQAEAVGTTGSGAGVFANTWYLMDAGSPGITVIAAPGGHNGISVHDRGDTWGYAVDFIRNQGDYPWDMQMGQNTYRIVARGTAPAGTGMVIQATLNPWGHLFHTDTAANGQWEFNVLVNNDIIMEHTYPAEVPGREIPQFAGGFRITTYTGEEGNNPDYTIHDFIVTRVG